MAASPTAAFHVLAKPTGAICNLDCKYCFYLSKERLYPGSAFRMSDEVLEAFVRQRLEAGRSGAVTISWQGGEPTLMGLDFFRRSIAVERKHRRPGITVEHVLQTNATLLDDDWCAFLAEHDFLVGVSVDGPRALHDAFRVDKGGHPTFDRVMRGVRLLRAHGVRLNALAAVHAANAPYPLDVYRFLKEEVSPFIQLIPIVERDETMGAGAVTARSVSAEDYGRFLVEIFDEWIREDVGDVFVQAFDVALESWHLGRSSLCVFAETCGDAVVLEHGGDVYSCDHFVDDAHRLGDVRETPLAELVASDRQRRFGADKRDTLPEYCRRCDVRFACHGGCPKDRFVETPDGEPGLNYLCAGYRTFFRHVDGPMRAMAALLRSGRPASDVRKAFADVGASPRH
jgi:uncharacterized protein